MNITCPNRRCRCDFTGDESLVGRLVECTDCRSAFYFPHRGEDATEDLDEFVIFDLETTGTSHRSHEIIQIAALRLKAGRLVERDRFFSYVRAADSIGTFITSLTGITDADVRNAPTIRQALPEFSKFVGDAVLIAHNGKSFDRWFLKSACILNGIESREVECIDSMDLSRQLYGTTRGISHSLDAVMSRIGLESGSFRRHDARGDVHILGRAVEIMWDRLSLDSACSSVKRSDTLLPSLD